MHVPLDETKKMGRKKSSIKYDKNIGQISIPEPVYGKRAAPNMYAGQSYDGGMYYYNPGMPMAGR